MQDANRKIFKTHSISTKMFLGGRREILFPLGQVYKLTKGRQYLKTIKHNLCLQKANFKPLFTSGRSMVAPSPGQHFPGSTNYRQNKLNTNFSAWSLNNEKQETQITKCIILKFIV